MTRLPSELNGVFATSLPLDPLTFRVGAFDSNAHLDERIQCRGMLQGKLQLIKLQHLYTTAYFNSSNPTVHQWRDLLISFAIYCIIRNSQTKDSTGVELTQHSKSFWASTYSIPFLELITANNTNGGSYAGGVGSVLYDAYPKQDLPQLSPLDLVNQILTTFWKKYHLYVVLNPAVRHQRIMNNLFSTTLDWKKVEDSLNKVWYTPLEQQPIESRNILSFLRRNLVTPANWEQLKQRIITGELTSEVETAVALIQRAANQPGGEFYELAKSDPNIINEVRNRRLQTAPPGGLAMYYLAFASLGFIRAAKRLSTHGELLATPYSSFINSPAELNLKSELARDLLLSYDAFGALGFFDQLKEAKGLAYRSYVQAAQLTKYNPTFVDAGDTRLYSFL